MVTILTLTILSLSPPARAGGAHSSNGHHGCDVDELLEDYLALFNDRLTDWTGVLDPDYAVESPYGSFDLAGWQGLTGAAWAAFPDMQWSLVRVVADDDRVALEYSFTGTFQSDFLTFVARGQTVVGRGMEMHEIDRRSCRILRTWNYSDAYGFFAQIQ